jgi:integrase/recombinase XerD
MLRPLHGVPRSSVGRPSPDGCAPSPVLLLHPRGGPLEHSPAAHLRRPRLDYESHAVGLVRNDAGAQLVAAGLGTAAEHALISLLAINGLRISEALGADIDKLGLERGHRTLTMLRKGGKVVAIPLALRTAGAMDLAIGEGLAP